MFMNVLLVSETILVIGEDNYNDNPQIFTI